MPDIDNAFDTVAFGVRQCSRQLAYEAMLHNGTPEANARTRAAALPVIAFANYGDEPRDAYGRWTSAGNHADNGTMAHPHTVKSVNERMKQLKDKHPDVMAHLLDPKRPHMTLRLEGGEKHLHDKIVEGGGKYRGKNGVGNHLSDLTGAKKVNDTLGKMLE